MPWNEDNDDEMNDRAGRNSTKIVRNDNARANLGISPIPNANQHNIKSGIKADEDSLDDIERQIQMIENAHASRATGVRTGTKQNVSFQSNYSGSAEEETGDHVGDDEMFNAIVASLIDYTGNDKVLEEQKKNTETENRQLKEAIVISKLEDDKKAGKLNLDFLKKKG